MRKNPYHIGRDLNVICTLSPRKSSDDIAAYIARTSDYIAANIAVHIARTSGYTAAYSGSTLSDFPAFLKNGPRDALIFNPSDVAFFFATISSDIAKTGILE